MADDDATNMSEGESGGDAADESGDGDATVGGAVGDWAAKSVSPTALGSTRAERVPQEVV